MSVGHWRDTVAWRSILDGLAADSGRAPRPSALLPAAAQNCGGKRKKKSGGAASSWPTRVAAAQTAPLPPPVTGPLNPPSPPAYRPGSLRRTLQQCMEPGSNEINNRTVACMNGQHGSCVRVTQDQPEKGYGIAVAFFLVPSGPRRVTAFSEAPLPPVVQRQARRVHQSRRPPPRCPFRHLPAFA